mmetsp:Transcript_5477/g.17278  ORF Transcript_5477/g.17278 Transcript_5477/m.17278 type:complete len:297 (-) Transcript_5477:269-1159(-)
MPDWFVRDCRRRPRRRRGEDHTRDQRHSGVARVAHAIRARPCYRRRVRARREDAQARRGGAPVRAQHAARQDDAGGVQGSGGRRVRVPTRRQDAHRAHPDPGVHQLRVHQRAPLPQVPCAHLDLSDERRRPSRMKAFAVVDGPCHGEHPSARTASAALVVSDALMVGSARSLPRCRPDAPAERFATIMRPVPFPPDPTSTCASRRYGRDCGWLSGVTVSVNGPTGKAVSARIACGSALSGIDALRLSDILVLRNDGARSTTTTKLTLLRAVWRFSHRTSADVLSGTVCRAPATAPC